MLVTKLGMSIRFAEEEVSLMGRAAGGVRGIQLKEDDEVAAALQVIGDEGEITVMSDLGWGKRSLLLDYPTQGRGGKGIATFEFKEGKRVKPNGSRLIGAFFSKTANPITFITDAGHAHTLLTEQAPLMDRKAHGRSLVPMDKGEEIAATVVIGPRGD